MDSERTLWALKEAGATLTTDENEADLLIANTCGFIDDAKKESVDAVLRLAEIKEGRPNVKLAVMGCLSERYRDDLKKSIPEIDHMYGVSDLRALVERLAPNPASFLPDPDSGPRILSTAPHWAYLKIAEGCSNSCSFCVIPSIRGPFRSRDPESLLAEAGSLASMGVKELIVVAQDSTLYGADLKMRDGLAHLLRRLARVEGIEWIRTLYLYPALVNKKLLEVFEEEEKIAPYFDLPLQHVSDKVLKAMSRPDTCQSIKSLVEDIRNKIPEASIRASFIIGFPGETEQDFETLFRFVQETRLDHMGAFIYSRQIGSPAYDLPGSVKPAVAQDRRSRLMEEQKVISKSLALEKIGKTYRVMVDMFDKEANLLTGRLITQAPQIDGAVILDSIEASPGDIIPVNITGSLDYDLIAKHPEN